MLVCLWGQCLRISIRVWHHRWYHPQMNKTTVYLPDDLRDAVKRAALSRGVSEAEVIRDAIRDAVAKKRPKPKFGLISGGEPIAHRVDELLNGDADHKGFGEW